MKTVIIRCIFFSLFCFVCSKFNWYFTVLTDAIPYSILRVKWAKISLTFLVALLLIKTFKASLYSSEKHFIFNNVLLMNRQLALKVNIIDKDLWQWGLLKIKCSRAMPSNNFIFNNPLAIGLYLLLNLIRSFHILPRVTQNEKHSIMNVN